MAQRQLSMTLAILMLCSRGTLADESGGFTWEELDSGLRFERERLISGIYSATGKEAYVRADRTDDFELLSVFSFAEDKIRFERRGREPLRRGEELIEGNVHRLVCLLPDKSFVYDRSEYSRTALHIIAPGLENLRHRPGLQGYIDPRCLGGLLALWEMERGVRFEDVAGRLNTLASQSQIRIVDEGHGVYRAWSVTANGRWSVWIDVPHGFTLVRMLVEIGRGDAATGDFSPRSEVIAQDGAMRTEMEQKGLYWDPALDVTRQIDVGWKQVSGVWVPTSYQHVSTAQQRVAAPAPGGIAWEVVRPQYSLTLDWISVNAGPYDHMFDYHSFDLPAGTPVLDLREPGGPQVDVIRSIGVTSGTAGASEGAFRTRSRAWIVVLTVIFLGLCALVVAHFWFRRRRAAGMSPLRQ